MLVYKLYNSGSVVMCYEKLWYLEVLALRDNLAAEACIAGFFAGDFNILCFHICDTFWIFRPQDNLDDMSKICRYRRTLGSAPLPLKRALMNDDTLNNTDDTVDIVDNTTVTTVTDTADTTDTVNDTVKML